MLADEARELMTGSMKRKGPWFKFRLTWMCGRINGLIEKNAESGENCAIIQVKAPVAKQYFPLMAKMYEDLGYIVMYRSDTGSSCKFVVWWGWDNLSDGKKRSWLHNNYNYYTPGIEPKEEELTAVKKKRFSLQCFDSVLF